MYPDLYIKRLSGTAILPTYGSEGAIGLDLYSDQYVEVFPGQRVLVSTNIAMEIPFGYYGRIAPRSGLAVKSGIDVLAGVIDSDYRGEVKVLVINHGANVWEINPGDRVAQLILECADRLQVVEVNELDATKRGTNGYGSTGR